MHTRSRALPIASLITVAAALVAAASSFDMARAQTRPPAKKPAAPPAAEIKVPFWAGETLTYNVGWSTYFTAGTATMRVQERRELGSNRAAYVLVAEGKPGTILSKLYD